MSGGAPTRRNPRVCGHARVDAELPGMGETKGLMKAAPKRPAASRLRYRSAGYQMLVFILLPLLVLATVITFLLVQRARRKRDAGQ